MDGPKTVLSLAFQNIAIGHMVQNIGALFHFEQLGPEFANKIRPTNPESGDEGQ